MCAADAKCVAWTFHSGNGPHKLGACYLGDSAHCRSVDGAVGGCKPPCGKGPGPDPGVCEPVYRPPAPKLVPLPTGIKTRPHIVSVLVDDLGFDDLVSHDTKAGELSFSPTVQALMKEGVRLNRHHTYMWCSPTRRSFITGRYLVHITGIQAGIDTNLTPLQFTLLSEKLRAADYESYFLGKGHMGWQTTDHLLVNRGFEG